MMEIIKGWSHSQPSLIDRINRRREALLFSGAERRKYEIRYVIWVVLALAESSAHNAVNGKHVGVSQSFLAKQNQWID